MEVREGKKFKVGLRILFQESGSNILEGAVIDISPHKGFVRIRLSTGRETWYDTERVQVVKELRPRSSPLIETRERKEVYDLIKKVERPMRAPEISRLLHRGIEGVYTILHRMVKSKQLVKISSGVYDVPDSLRCLLREE